MIERPELIQAHRSHRNEHLLFKAIVGCLIGLTAVLVLAMHSHAATVEIGIAPPGSNTPNASNALKALKQHARAGEFLRPCLIMGRSKGFDRAGIETAGLCLCAVMVGPQGNRRIFPANH